HGYTCLHAVGRGLSLRRGAGARGDRPAQPSAAVNARALSAITCQRPSATSVGATTEVPAVTASAPARRNDAALSASTPPDGIRGASGNGPRRSEKYFGPNPRAGKILTASAPIANAVMTSDGVRAPMTAAACASCAAATTFAASGPIPGVTRNCAP